MMGLDHETLVVLTRSAGLVYFMLLAAGVVVYTFLPRNKKRFDDAARSIIDDEDRPCR